ncbi:hypothetical protein HOG98_01760 [bacterium]|jgi:hypothetical protein|nr:hypothetical protein [bacterium]
MNTKLIKRILFGLFLTLAVVLARLIPHPPNFTPLLAMTIFCAVSVEDKKWALLMPLIAMGISDIALGWHPSMVFVYGAIIIIGALSIFLCKSQKISSISMTTLISPLIFYGVTNFGVWAVTSMYSKTVLGLYMSYIAGLPFLKVSMNSTIFFSCLLFVPFFIVKHSKTRDKASKGFVLIP